MVGKLLENILLILIVSALMAVQSTTASIIPAITENTKFVEFTARLDELQTMVELLQVENVKLTSRVSDLEAENRGLKSDVNQLKLQLSKQDKEQDLLKIIHSNNWASKNRMDNDGASVRTKINQRKITHTDDDSSTRAIAPSSCRELALLGHSLDGLYLVQNVDTNKIGTVLCNFGTSNISQQLIGEVDVKTKSVHFYVQRNTVFSSNAVIPWELARLNEGGDMDLANGIFTVPLDGIYHFEFSGLKDQSANYFYVILQVNGVDIGSAGTTNGPNTGTYEGYSLAASLRLKTGDRVNLFNAGGALYENGNHKIHFSGWLVEQDLSPVV